VQGGALGLWFKQRRAQSALVFKPCHQRRAASRVAASQ
jgi:hypothetical protein